MTLLFYCNTITYMVIYTAAEIVERIKRLDGRIEKSEEAYQVSLSTGQGSQTVIRQQLENMYTARKYWMGQLEDVDPDAVSEDGGLLQMELSR